MPTLEKIAALVVGDIQAAADLFRPTYDRTNGADGVKGLYLKQVNGSVLANLEDSYVFEPASSSSEA